MAFYRCIGGNGGGGVTPTDITPSDSSPVALSANGVYKALAAGYAIESEPESVTPSAEGAAFSAGINKMTSAGYAYDSQVTPGFPYTKSGTLADFTSVNQEQSVDTGLSSIKYVYVEGWAYSGTILQSAWLDKDKSVAKQVAIYSNTGGTPATGITSGSDADGLITGNTGQIKVSGISGGTITIKTGNSNNYLSKNVKWYAG